MEMSASALFDQSGQARSSLPLSLRLCVLSTIPMRYLNRTNLSIAADVVLVSNAILVASMSSPFPSATCRGDGLTRTGNMRWSGPSWMSELLSLPRTATHGARILLHQ